MGGREKSVSSVVFTFPFDLNAAFGAFFFFFF
jgi:hypothetical protein